MKYLNALIPVLVLAVPLARGASAAPGVSFGSPQVISTGPSLTNGVAIAYDSLNRPHISYIDYTGGNMLKYARWTGASWEVVTFHNVRIGSAQDPTSIALDSSDNPHIACAGGGVDYVYRSGGSWFYEDVGNVTTSPSIRVGTDGRPRMSYIEWAGSNRLVRFAIRGAGGGWTVETAHTMSHPSTGLAWGWCSLALDTSNGPNISFEDVDSFDTRYAYKSGSTWIKITVDSSANETGRVNAIEMDSLNRRYIAYTDDTADSVKIAFQTGSGWLFETVASNSSPFKCLNVDVAPDGTIGVGFADGGLFSGSRMLVYRRIGGAWTLRSISGDGYWDNGAFAFDNTGAIGIAAGGDGAAALSLNHYAISSAGVVVSQLVDSGGPMGQDSLGVSLDGQIVVLSAGRAQQLWLEGTSAFGGFVTRGPGEYRYADVANSSATTHVSYYDSSTTALFVAEKTGVPPIYGPNEWTSVLVDNTADVGQYTSIAAEAGGNLHVTYYDNSNSDLRYAKRTAGVWATTAVDTGSNVGWDSSVALNLANAPRVSYYDITNGDLKFAYHTGGAWAAPQTVDSAGTVGEYTSLAYDGANVPHISYFDRTNGQLKYAKGPIGSWASTPVDSGGVGQYTGIATDTANNPHIAYYDYAQGDLKHAWHNGASWAILRLDSAGNVGRNAQIGISGNTIRISYHDLTNGWVKQVTGYYDYTVPSGVVITDGGEFTTSATTLSAAWTAASDAETPIAEYRYAIGTTATDPGSGYVLSWTSTGLTRSANRSGLALANGVVYYFYVQAKNAAGQWGPVAASDGIRAVKPVAAIGDAKREPDGVWVQLANKVASRDASFYFFYVQEPERSSGIQVYSTEGSLPAGSLVKGSVVTVTGVMSGAGAERQIQKPRVAITGSTDPPRPLHMTNSRLGGSDFYYVPGVGGSGQVGSPARRGLNNVGLYVRTSGKVVSKPSVILFVIDDGSVPGGVLVSNEVSYGQPPLGKTVEVYGHPTQGGGLWLEGAGAWTVLD